MTDFTEVDPALDSSFALPPDSVAFYADHQEKRSRLTTFFRLICVLPHAIWLALYGIAAFFAVVGAWFVLLFTAKFPEGLYKFLEDYHRYYVRVYSYGFLITDKFPPFNGNPDEPYAAHFLLGPPLESYSRVKVFFRIILYIPFYIVAYIFTIVLELVSLVAWFAIVITGKEIDGLQNAMTYLFGFVTRAQVWAGLMTEEWPKFSDDDVNRSLQEKGYQGSIPPTDSGFPVGPPAGAQPPAPPAPPTPPTPPAPPTV
jgi:hypothetical protein